MIILDISKVEETVDAGLVYVQNDSVHLLEMTIQDNGAAVDLTGKTAKIRFCTRSGYVSDEPCTIVSAAAGTLSYKMLGAQLVRGEVLGIVSLYAGDERQSTSKFRLLCVDDLSSDDSVRDSVQYSELQKAITAAEAATGEANEAAEYAQSQGDYAKEKGDAVSLEWEPHVADKVIHITSEERAGWNNKVDKAEGKGLSDNNYTDADKIKLDGIEAGAEVNQNAFGVVSVDGVFDINATSKTDKLNIVGGSNITLNNYDDYGYQAVHISATDTTYENATETKAGLMSSADKAKLDTISVGAEPNDVTSVAGKTGAVSLDKSDVGLGNLTNDKQAKETDFNAHVGNTSNPHNVTKEQLGIENVDNTSDMDKPVSTAQAAALALKADKAEFDAHNADGERHITAAERARWDSSAIVGDASGEKIVLDDVAPQGAIRELEIYGKSEQETSVQGKNLLDTTGIGVGSNFDNYVNDVTFTHQSDGGVKVTGTYMNEYSPYSTRFELIDKLTVGKTYVKSMTGGVTGINFAVVVIKNDDTSTRPTTFTLDDTVKSVKAYLEITKIDDPIDTTVYLQVEEGSAATAYEPFVPNKPSPEYPSEIKSAENFTALFLRGKNLLDTSGMGTTAGGITYTPQADGSVKVAGTSTGFGSSKLIDITSRLTLGKKYVKSMKGGVSGLTMPMLVTPKTGSATFPSTFTMDETIESVKVYLQVNSADIAVDTTVYLQVEEGSAATAYEPYGGTVVNIPYELRGVPNSTGGWLARDYIEVKDGAVKLVRECGELACSGGENWIYSATDNYEMYFLLLADGKGLGYGDIWFKTSHYKVAYTVTQYAYPFAMNTYEGRFQPSILCALGTYGSSAAWKTYLAGLSEAGNPLTILYQLATPTIEDITETETGQALLALTLTAPTASVSNTADSGMAVRYEVDGTIAYKKLASAIVALGGTI